MMLFNLSLQNIKKSMKDYAIYFFTLILGVAIFYVFNAIDSQTVMFSVSSSTYEIIDIMISILSGVSIFVAFILGFLIIYASRFLMKRRNKEFGIYLTLGMSKRKISLILFLETLLIGLISLVVGLGIGFCLSQFMSILVANMFEADMKNFKFIFSTTACLKTLICFGIMYLIVMIFNVFSISKCKLIDLINTNKKSEKIKFKNTGLCIIVFLISITALGYAYYLVTDGIDKLTTANMFLIPIALGAISTFFIFWSLSGLILKIMSSMKKIYYKGLNSFIIRQISSKVNTTVFSMTIICLMLFVTICVLSTALSLKNSMIANVKKLAPVDVEISKTMNLPYDTEYYSKEEVDNSYLSINESLDKLDLSLNNNFKEYITVNLYTTDELTMTNTLGSMIDVIKKDYPYMSTNILETIMKISDYNKVAELYHKETYDLNEKEYMVIADFESMMNIRNVALENREKITVFGHTLTPKYTNCKEGFVHISSNHSNSGIILVPDEIVDENFKSKSIFLGNYKVNNKEEKLKIDDDLINKVSTSYDTDNLLSINTKMDITNSSVGLGALVTFIGLYLGIIFLISSAAILALKELSESTDNKERFGMIRKLGADEKMINKALFRQIGIFFLFPLIVAIIHSIFGLRFCAFILETFGKDKLVASIIMTAIFLISIYGGYFLLTYLCSKNIIKEK